MSRSNKGYPVQEVVYLIDFYHKVDQMTHIEEEEKQEVRHLIYSLIQKISGKVPKKLKLDIATALYSSVEWEEISRSYRL